MIKNEKTKDPIEPAKQSPSATVQIYTALFAYIATLPIV